MHALHRRRIRARDVALPAALWLAGTLPYSALVVSDWLDTGDLRATLRSALFGDAFRSNVLNTTVSLRLLGISAGFVLYNFPNLLLPAAAYGVGRGRRLDVPRSALWALLAGLAIHAAFALRYDIADQYTYLFTPWSVAERSAERMSREAVALAGERGLVLYEDSMGAFALRYQALRAGRAEETIQEATSQRASPRAAELNRRIAQVLDRRGTVVLVPRDVNRVGMTPPVGRWERRGDLYALRTEGR